MHFSEQTTCNEIKQNFPPLEIILADWAVHLCMNAHEHTIFSINTIFKQFLTLIIHLFYVKQMRVFVVGFVF